MHKVNLGPSQWWYCALIFIGKVQFLVFSLFFFRITEAKITVPEMDGNFLHVFGKILE